MNTNNKPIIYLAGPYTKGDPAINTHVQIVLFNELLDDNIVTPIAPLAMHFLHTMYPRPYSEWTTYDMEIIEICAACLYNNAVLSRMKYIQIESSGAAAEIKRFEELERPVFYDKSRLYEWVTYRESLTKLSTMVENKDAK